MTEDKLSSSHVVVPIPANLEDGMFCCFRSVKIYSHTCVGYKRAKHKGKNCASSVKKEKKKVFSSNIVIGICVLFRRVGSSCNEERQTDAATLGLLA